MRSIGPTCAEKELDGVEVVVVEGLPTFHLKLGKLAVDLLKLAVVIVEPPLPENSKGRTSR